MENNLFYDLSANTTPYLNLARDLSRINSKNEEVTTRDGHVYGYMCEFTATGTGTSNSGLFLSTAPNSWRMRNSFRKFHAYRNIMFENAGVTDGELGRYGKTIRPYLDAKHSASTTLEPVTLNSDGSTVTYNEGEWTYSKLAVTPTYQATVPIDPTEEYWADSFDLHICEANIVSGGTEFESGYYKSVGMIHSYNIDRQEVTTPTSGADEAITGPSNPLAQLISSGNQAVGEVIEITEDQELELPPYDLDNDGHTIETVISSFVSSSAQTPTLRFSAFVPAGLARLTVGLNDMTLSVRVVGKVLCKDMA